MTPIKSNDPRKPAIVAALKQASRCRKVTNVKQIAPGRYQGDCMWPNSPNSDVGTVIVDLTVKCMSCGTADNVKPGRDATYPLCDKCLPGYLEVK